MVSQIVVAIVAELYDAAAVAADEYEYESCDGDGDDDDSAAVVAAAGYDDAAVIAAAAAAAETTWPRR